MKCLIVNADDFGLTEGVNRAVLDGYKNGILSSTSLMANGAAFDDAVARARDMPGLGVGVHLNLVEGLAITLPKLLPHLVERDGNFKSGPGRLAALVVTRRISSEEIELELRAQIEKVMSAGIRPSHLDGHKHVQAIPEVFRIAVKLAREYQIHGIRCTVGESGITRLFRLIKLGSPPRMFMQLFAGRLMSVFSGYQKRVAARAGLAFPDRFYGVTETGFLDNALLKRIINELPEGSSELMCHPGYLDESLKKMPTRLVKQRENELCSITGKEIIEMVASAGIKLINYTDLKVHEDGK